MLGLTAILITGIVPTTMLRQRELRDKREKADWCHCKEESPATMAQGLEMRQVGKCHARDDGKRIRKQMELLQVTRVVRGFRILYLM